MNFEKKLIILTGDFNAKGTLTLERNAYGTFATVNIYNIPDLTYGEYIFGLKGTKSILRRELGGLGRILLRFKIDEVEFDKVHCIIFSSVEEVPLLYGTIASDRLWHANMMDGLRKIKRGEIIGTKSEDLEYSSREEANIENFFLDILPKDHADYSDNVVAQVNYYPDDMKIDVSYSPRSAEKVVLNPLDEMAGNGEWGIGNRDSARNSQCTTHNEDENLIQNYGENSVGDDTLIVPNQTLMSQTLLIDDKKNDYNNNSSFDASNSTHNEAASTSSIYQSRGDIPQMESRECGVESGIKDEFIMDNSKLQTSDSKLNPTIQSLTANHQSFATIPPLSSFTVENAVNNSQTKTIFYEMIKDQLDEMFKNNPPYEPLAALMPQTKWVRIEYDDKDKFYVVGLVGEKPDYICYGVPAKYSQDAPEELDGFAQWMPLNPKVPEDEGFWLMFQDAESGESVEV
ncbi:MAG: hypothetical protein FWE22_00105 [Firmicutes bacterium]|nr:hypothetical protein [Bacillota bacterium]